MWAILAILILFVLYIVYVECLNVHFVIPSETSNFTTDTRTMREIQATDNKLAALCKQLVDDSDARDNQP